MTIAKLIAIFVVFIVLLPFFRMEPGGRALASMATSNLDLVNASPAGELIVPDDYPTIEAAIGNASAGDTVFVKKGTYNVADRLLIDKPLELIGEDNQKTILNGHKEYSTFGSRDTISIEASDVVISGFTITNCQRAIDAYYNNFNLKIIGNNIVNNGIGIYLDSTVTNCLISENCFLNNGQAISGNMNDSEINSNVITNNDGGLSLFESQKVTLTGNEISSNSFGLVLEGVSSSHIYGNNIAGNVKNYQSTDNVGFGIQFRINCNDCFVYENTISRNIFGVEVVNSQLGVLSSFGSGNVVYRNNLVNNSQNANVDRRLPYNATINSPNGTASVSWDNGGVGNYWSDYQLKYPNATEVDTSGIGNYPYIIDENNTDNYPLIKQVNISTEEQTAPFEGWPLLTAIIVIAVFVAIAISFFIYTRHKRKNKVFKK